MCGGSIHHCMCRAALIVCIAFCALGAPHGASVAEAQADEQALAAAQTTLDEFMEARVRRQFMTARSYLSDEFDHSTDSRSQLDQLSNPCWYRYESLVLDLVSPAAAQGR